MEIDNYLKFTTCVANIFRQAGYDIIQLNNEKEGIDLIASLDGNKYAIMTKYRYIQDSSINRLVDVANKKCLTPVLICGFQLEFRNSLESKYKNVIFIDITNLFYEIESNIELKNELTSCLSYSISGIKTSPSPLNISSLKHDDYTKNLIEQIKRVKSGKEESDKYEDLCIELLKNVFSDDLELWNSQKKATGDLFRFDLICRIKDSIKNKPQSQFWNIIENYFNSKYIVFEFKNYCEKITQKEIYMTERYLYTKALRSVAIMFSQNGYDDNSKIASKGCLRENGKLILLLTTTDLIDMNIMKENGDEPSDLLLDRLDDILIRLEK